MTITTIYALFGDDIRMLAFSKEADEIFYYITCVSMFLFTLEIVIASICKPDYIFGFYFWLDVISTVSLITDIGWIMNSILGQEGGIENAQQAAKVARASRGARIGTRAGRIARVIRLIRLVRIVKLYKSANNAI